MKCPQIYTSIDLELNADGKQTFDIIQIGAVIGNVITGEVLEELSLYVDIKKPLYPFITELTGITDYTIQTKGTTLVEAYNTLKEAHKKHGAHHMVVQWGGGDEYALKKQLIEAGMDPREWCFGRTFWNVKTLVQALQLSKGLTIQGGLKKSCHKYNVKFQGPAHDALFDSLNTFRLFSKLLRDLKNV